MAVLPVVTNRIDISRKTVQRMPVAVKEAQDTAWRMTDSCNKRHGDSNKRGRSPSLEGYLYIGIGILFILGPIVSSISFFFSSLQDNESHYQDGMYHRLLRYWNEIHPFMRVLTVLPPTIVICICHWVSLRIYLRR